MKTLRFFQKQKYDEAGHIAVRLQIIVFILSFLLLIRTLLSITSTLLVYDFLVDLVFNIFAWIVLLLGFIGAFKRNPPVLIFFGLLMLINFLATLLNCAALIFALFGRKLTSKQWTIKLEHKELTIVLSVLCGTDVVASLLAVFLQVYSVYISFFLARLLWRTKSRRSLGYLPPLAVPAAASTGKTKDPSLPRPPTDASHINLVHETQFLVSSYPSPTAPPPSIASFKSSSVFQNYHNVAQSPIPRHTDNLSPAPVHHDVGVNGDDAHDDIIPLLHKSEV